MADVRVQDEGSLLLLHLDSQAARDWVADNVGHPTTYWAGALVVEPRYLDGVVAGMREAGLWVGPWPGATFHQDLATCACGGSGWIPTAGPGDEPCPYHSDAQRAAEGAS